MARILVVDDDSGFQRLLVTILKGEGYEVDTAGTAAQAVQAGERRKYDLVLTDLRLPDGDGLSILRKWHERDDAPFIVITAFGTIASAVEAMKGGAVDYLTKPLGSPDQLRLLVQKTLRQSEVTLERDTLREECAARFACGSLIATDARMKSVLELVRKVAPTPATVLITGESGTGKELIARCIHENSPRAARMFVPVNCAALSPTLIESELFGHEKGAFTGAMGQHLGRFERANGGTLFLDEIGELDANLQSKLLRVLQDRTLERVGGTRQISVDVRVVAASNRDLRKQIEAGKFREDLYYRLNGFPVDIPPLRDRPADITVLARFFLERAAQQLGRRPPALSEEAAEALRGYSWPGNVRELENMMERVAILCERTIQASDLPIAATAAPRPVLFKDIERTAIEDALRENAGNRTHAARQLGISLRTLQYRIKEYGLS